MRRPNILIITLHDLGDFLPCYGTPVTAPNLDRMAGDGVVFANHFSTGTVCSPSRGSITTGCYPHTNGLMGLVHRGWHLDTNRCPHIASMLRGAGYETHLFGFQHEHYDTTAIGYEQVHNEGVQAEQVQPVIVDWLKERGRQDAPFFAAVGTSEVHRLGGWEGSHFKRDVYEPADPKDVVVPPWLPDLPEVREDLAWFYGAVRHADKMVGAIMDALDEAGLRDDTLLIFTTDHGASFQHAKATLYDGGTKVSLLMRWPGNLPRGKRVEALTSHVDILPTVFDLIGLNAPHYVEGRSALPLARGDDDAEAREFVFAEKNMTNYFDPSRMARSKDYKYIRKGVRSCIFDFVIPEIESMTWGFRKSMDTLNFYDAHRTTEELYDLRKDPGELNNLADDPAYQTARGRLRRALTDHMKATKDPFAEFKNELHLHETGYAGLREKRNRE